MDYENETLTEQTVNCSGDYYDFSFDIVNVEHDRDCIENPDGSNPVEYDVLNDFDIEVSVFRMGQLDKSKPNLYNNSYVITYNSDLIKTIVLRAI